MLKHARRRLALLAGLAILTGGCVVDAQGIAATGTFDRTMATAGQVDLDVQTGSGSIEIRRGSDSQVHVIGHIRAQRGFWNNLGAEERVRRIEANPPVVQAGSAVRVGEHTDADLFRNVSISYEITVPGDTRVRSRSGSGSVHVDSLRGPLEARTGSGSIDIGEMGGSVEANTGSGSIEVLGASGGLNASTGSGSIHARQIAGRVNASSGSGEIQIALAATGGAVRAHTGSGSIRVDGRPAAEWALETGSGGITLRLPNDAAFEVNARTNSGSVTTTHPIEVVGTVSKRSLQGRVRGGGPRLDVSAGSGSIRLE